jgi:hypothetical protein
VGLISKLLGHANDLTPEQARRELGGMLLPDEPVQVAFKVVWDLFVFTDRRLILVDRQGFTGRKVEYLVIPYRAITSYSIENAGTFDMDSELRLWISGRHEPIQKTLKSGANIRGIQAAIASALWGKASSSSPRTAAGQSSEFDLTTWLSRPLLSLRRRKRLEQA